MMVTDTSLPVRALQMVFAASLPNYAEMPSSSTSYFIGEHGTVIYVAIDAKHPDQIQMCIDNVFIHMIFIF